MPLESKFQSFDTDISLVDIPIKLDSPFNTHPQPIAEIAAKQLQKHLTTQSEWTHNFGLIPGMTGKEIGKMFGVLVVKNAEGSIGFISAFSGKLAGKNHHSMFVPPVFDSLKEGGFLNLGMLKLSEISKEIKKLVKLDPTKNQAQINELKLFRKNTSISLQRQLFDNYHFLNQLREAKTAWDLFDHSEDKLPPSGVGECAAPKLLNYAFQHSLRPISIAEFWWGKPTKSDAQIHKNYYPACRDKCKPILKHMLSGL